MKKLLISATVGLFLVSSSSFAQQPPSHPTATPPQVTEGVKSSAEVQSSAEVKAAMRKLWEEHMIYTRNALISILADLPDIDAVAQRLLKNQDDIGNAITPYYGSEAGKKLSTLLREHIKIAVEVVKAAKSGDKKQLASAQEKWSANGTEIAAFLSSANPNWPKSVLESMMQAHLDLTTEEVANRLKKDWQADINSFDAGNTHMLMFSDTLVEGIAKQFPDKFTQ